MKCWIETWINGNITCVYFVSFLVLISGFCTLVKIIFVCSAFNLFRLKIDYFFVLVLPNISYYFGLFTFNTLKLLNVYAPELLSTKIWAKFFSLVNIADFNVWSFHTRLGASSLRYFWLARHMENETTKSKFLEAKQTFAISFWGVNLAIFDNE